MTSTDEQIEMLLRQFQARAPRPLGIAEAPRRLVWGWAWVGAAAASALFAANVRFMPMASITPDDGSPRLTVSGMRRFIDAGPAELDRALLEASRSMLPDVEAPISSLHQFAQP